MVRRLQQDPQRWYVLNGLALQEHATLSSTAKEKLFVRRLVKLV